MAMYNTKYPNNIRTVSGLNVAVFDNDVVLAVNTSGGPCSINLNAIPSGFWSTQWKLYIYDASNNASVNNITINAGSGQTINNSSSIVLSTNGAGAVVSIINNTSFIGVLNTNSSAIISATDSSTIDFTVTGNNLTGSVKYQDSIVVKLNTTDVNVNYYPKVPIYNPAGTISGTFYSDIQYAASLGTHDIKNYSVITPTGNFTAGSVDNSTGYITIPTNGLYVLFSDLRAIITTTTVGPNSILSNNINTNGIAWNNNTAKNYTAYMQLSICLNAVAGTGNNATKIELTDMGGFKLSSPVVVAPLVANQKVKLVVLNNTDLDYYGATASAVGLAIIKLAEI